MKPTGRIWLLSLIIGSAAAATAFLQIDVPLARIVYGRFGPLDSIGTGFGSTVLLATEASVVLILAFIRLRGGPLSPLYEAVALACFTSICAYAINAGVLKVLFGVSNPAQVLHGARHSLNWLRGSAESSFPSGHMVLAGAFCGVLMRLYRTGILPLVFLLMVAAALLVGGAWHFLSDVIAGTVFGIWIGLLAAELWLDHSDNTDHDLADWILPRKS